METICVISYIYRATLTVVNMLQLFFLLTVFTNTVNQKSYRSKVGIFCPLVPLPDIEYSLNANKNAEIIDFVSSA